MSDGSQLTGWNASREPGGPLRLSSLLASDAGVAPFSSRRDSIPRRPDDLSFGSATDRESAGAVLWLRHRSGAGQDQNAAGGPLQVRGAKYRKGLGTRSHSRVVYELGGQFRLFQATAAIDDYSQGKGSVRFKL